MLKNHTNALLSVGMCALLLVFTGCDDDTSYEENNEGGNTSAQSCGDGELTTLEDGTSVCVFARSLVIENGFQCPPSFNMLSIFGPIGLCSSGSLGNGRLEQVAREHRNRNPELWSEASCVADSECAQAQSCDDASCVESGTSPECAEGEQQVASASECLQDDAVCYELSDGNWCTGPDSGELSCEDLYAAFAQEQASIQSCTMDSECGQVLTGTSCGCTRDLVARLDADSSQFYSLMGNIFDAECDGFGSTCDCPEADGFACNSGVCGWNYIDNSAPQCAEGEQQVSDASGCLQDDAVCYELSDGTWCTGPDAPQCPEGLTAVANSSECLQDDAVCYELSDGTWCTGPDAAPQCAEGEQQVASSSECLQDDAVCYELSDGSWCTGPDAPECPEGLTAVADASECLQDDAICFQYSEGLWCTGPAGELACEDINAALAQEQDSIQSCTMDSECGQVLTGTSCGCTRDLVARTDADSSQFYSLMESASNAQCDGFASTCDCPEADGFICNSGICGWNYVSQ